MGKRSQRERQTKHTKSVNSTQKPECHIEPAFKSTSLRSNYVLVGIVPVVLSFIAYLFWSNTLGTFVNPGSFAPEIPSSQSTVETIRIESHQNVSLHEKYTVDNAEMLRIREENMKKYPYSHSKTEVDKRSNLSLQEFRDVYDGKWPVVLTDVVSQWAAINWSREFFFEHYGDQRTTMKAVHGKIKDAVSLALPIELFYQNTHKAHPNSWTYVEDELFIPQRPELYRMIGNTPYLEEDYFQLFPAEVRPWNAMLLWGTAYSRSSMHIDPYNWTGTNAVIQGRKRWKLYPPGQDDLLQVIRGTLSGFPLNCYKYNSRVDAYASDAHTHTDLANAQVLEFDQYPGELLIIPTGWFHQAYNVEETLAFSSQVMNRNNFRIVLEEVMKITDNLQRSRLPEDIDTLSPSEQVEAVMSLLPDEILQRGKFVTEDAINQKENGPKSNPKTEP